jgi:hypothetical protein
MYKNFYRFILMGIAFTVIFGSLLHFVYEWTDSNPIVGLFSPVNESVFEHLKLLYYPMLIWVIIGYFKYGNKNRSYFPAAFCGLICGMLSIAGLFYIYTFFTGSSILVVDIIIFIISIIISYSIFAYLFLNYNFQAISIKCGILLWELIFVMFTVYYLFQ